MNLIFQILIFSVSVEIIILFSFWPIKMLKYIYIFPSIESSLHSWNIFHIVIMSFNSTGQECLSSCLLKKIQKLKIINNSTKKTIEELEYFIHKVLYMNGNEQITNTCTKMNKSCKHNLNFPKKARHKVYTTWFYLCKFQNRQN